MGNEGSSMTNIKPLGDHVLVKPVKQEEKTNSGIYLPDSAKDKPQEGEVLAVGSGKYIEGVLKPLEVKVGDKVIYTKYGGDEIKVDGEELKLVSESDILAIIE
jgi:chaperonin GroES